MKVSVVIPLFNKEPYIERAINSVLNQTILPDELIIVDDGSTDKGGEKVKAINDPRVRLITQDNAGECAARNRGVSEAKNDFVAFLDADDEWKPDFLSRIQKLIDSFPNSGAFATSSQIIKPDKSIVYPNLINIPEEPWIGEIQNFFDLFQHGYPFNASSIVIPKKVLELIGGFPSGVSISGDVACWVKIALRYPIAFDRARAVVYHQEAQNRVGHINMPAREMPYIHIIQEAIVSGSMPENLKEAALDFLAQKQILVASQNVMAGNPKYARDLLKSCHTNRKYRRAWLWWRFWAALPRGLPSQFMNAKNFIKDEINK